MSRFLDSIAYKFSSNAAELTARAFDNLAIPLPQDRNEYLDASEGNIVFLSKYGVVIRIEAKNPFFNHPDQDSCYFWKRIDDHPLVIQPLASIDCDTAAMEIIPATENSDPGDEMNAQYLKRRLRDDGIEYWDAKPANTGWINKIPVVIDRLAVRNLTTAQAIKNKLPETFPNPQEVFTPLKNTVQHALNQPSIKSMRRSAQYFWTLCRDFKENGKLVCGWETATPVYSPFDYNDSLKPCAAKRAAENYAKRFQP